MTALDDKLDQLQQQFWKLEKSKDMAIKLMKHGKISRKNEFAWNTLIYNLRLLIVSAKRKSLKNSSGAEIEKIKSELQKGLLLTKDLMKMEKKK